MKTSCQIFYSRKKLYKLIHYILNCFFKPNKTPTFAGYKLENFMTKSFFLFFFFALSIKGFSQGALFSTDSTESIISDTADVFKDLKYNIATISLDANELNESSDQNVSSILSGGRDPFINAAAFSFGVSRFRIRGYDADNFVSYMNGVPIENLDNGFTPYNLWSGLNDVTRFRDNSHGLAANSFAFGEIGGASAYDTRASKIRKQIRLSYAASNRTYDNRLMGTYASGILKGGWAVALTATRRWAKEGYVPGTFYDSWSYYGSVDKAIGLKNNLAFTFMGAPTRNGRSSSAIQEMRDLAGTNYYNPNWGYQNGEMRNASVANSHQPLFILTHEGKFTDKTNLLTSVAYSFGKRNQTGLDWMNAPDPRADYYRNLPSYYYLNGDSTQGKIIEDLYRKDENLRQIDWDNMYEANAISLETVKNVNGVAGNDITGKLARYIVEERVALNKRISAATTLNQAINEHLNLTAGLSYQWQQIENYKRVDDLMGADFYIDNNRFADLDYPNNDSALQNDLNNPTRLLKEGDKFGYDYFLTISRPSGWIQTVFKFNHIDFFVSAELSQTSYQRDGKTKYGIFPENSFGKSEKLNFLNYAFKGGLTYKINGRNYLLLNGSYHTKAPFFENAFISPRTNDATISNLKSETVYSGEVGYVLNSPRIKARAMMYFAQFNDQVNILSFYDESQNSFATYALSNIDKRHYGAELSVDAKIWQGLSATGALAVGRYYYNSRQNADVYVDNLVAPTQLNTTIYSKYFKVANTPQLAATAGLSYRSPKFWFVYVNANYFDQIYSEFNPARRTAAAVNFIDANSDQWDNILQQERLKGQFTLDASGGYSWRLNNTFKDLKKQHYLNFNVGLTNITNNRNFITGAFEQLRYDYENKNPDKFPSKYNYAPGISFFAGITYRM